MSFAGPLTHIPMGLMWYGIVALVVRGPFNIMYGASISRWSHAWVGGGEREAPPLDQLPTYLTNDPPTQPTTAGVPCSLRDMKCFWTNVCAAAGFSNLLLFLFNLFIPAYPLDACRILVDFFALCKVGGWVGGLRGCGFHHANPKNRGRSRSMRSNERRHDAGTNYAFCCWLYP